MLFISCSNVKKKDNPTERLSKKIDDFLTGLVANNNFCGSVLVMKDGQEVLKKGYGFANRCCSSF